MKLASSESEILKELKSIEPTIDIELSKAKLNTRRNYLSLEFLCTLIIGSLYVGSQWVFGKDLMTHVLSDMTIISAFGGLPAFYLVERISNKLYDYKRISENRLNDLIKLIAGQPDLQELLEAYLSKRGYLTELEYHKFVSIMDFRFLAQIKNLRSEDFPKLRRYRNRLIHQEDTSPYIGASRLTDLMASRMTGVDYGR